jgi:flagellar motor switch protein FliN
MLREDALTEEDLAELDGDIQDNSQNSGTGKQADSLLSQSFAKSTQNGNEDTEEVTEEDESQQAQKNIYLLMDVQVQVVVELGRVIKDVGYTLSLGEGSIIELDKPANEPVQLLVNERPIAKGEVVVIDENFGVRITEMLDPKERLKQAYN